MTESNRRYLDLDLSAGYPAGESIYYECISCGEAILSLPPHAMACKCRNVIVDSDSGRVSVKNPEDLKFFEVIES